MQRVKCIVHYAHHENAVLTIENITVVKKKGVTCLPKPTSHYYFMKDLMCDVLDVLRANNYYVSSQDEGATKWFDIIFFDMSVVYTTPYILGWVKNTDKGVVFSTPAARSFLAE